MERPKGEDVPAAAALMASVEAAEAAPPTEAAPPPLLLPEGAEEGAGGAGPDMGVHPPGYARLPVGELRSKARASSQLLSADQAVPRCPPRCWQVLEASKLPTTGTKDVLLARLQRSPPAPVKTPP